MSTPFTQLIECNGHVRTVEEWSKVTGIRTYDIRLRLRQGWNMTRIIDEVDPANRPHPSLPIDMSERQFFHDGESLTLQEWSARSGIAERKLRNRLVAGWSLQRALTETPRSFQPTIYFEPRRQARTITFDGRTMTTRGWAAYLGISTQSLNGRFKKGWPIERVLSEGAKPDAARYEHDGMKLTVAEWSELTGISTGTINDRIKRQWPMERVLTAKVRAKVPHRRRARAGNVALRRQGGGSATSQGGQGTGGGPSLVNASN